MESGGRIVWIGMTLTYLILLRASELFAVYCLRRGDMTFCAGEWQVEGGSSPGIDTVEVIFRGFTADQGRKGAELVRTKGDGSEGSIRSKKNLKGIRMHLYAM